MTDHAIDWNDQQQRFERAIDSAESFVVSTHLRPDGDAIGSETGLIHFLLSRGKQVRVINNDPTAESLRFVEPEGVDVEVYDPERHDELFRSVDRVMLVDNSAPDRLGRLEPIIREVAPKVLCIDHHPLREAPWPRPILDVDSGATAVMIYRLTRAFGWTPDLHAATAMYVGLSTDTGFFRFNSTNPQAHRIAAELLEMGVRPAKIYRAVHERNSVAFMKLLGHALATLRVEADGSIAVVTISQALIRDLDAASEDTSEITTALLSIEGVRAVALFRELRNGQIKVSLRSKSELNVHELACEYGGGGHRNASGIVMDGELDAVARQITERVRQGLAELEVGS